MRKETQKVLLPILFAAFFIIIIGILSQYLTGGYSLFKIARITPAPTGSFSEKKEIVLGRSKILVEIANTPQERLKGLSDRKSLGAEEGMLFVFQQKDFTPTFWMKNMLIPLDIIWIDNGKVSQIDKNVQPPPLGTPNSSLRFYRPSQPVDYVLEVNADFTERHNIAVGSLVDLSKIENK